MSLTVAMTGWLYQQTLPFLMLLMLLVGLVIGFGFFALFVRMVRHDMQSLDAHLAWIAERAGVRL